MDQQIPSNNDFLEHDGQSIDPMLENSELPDNFHPTGNSQLVAGGMEYNMPVSQGFGDTSSFILESAEAQDPFGDFSMALPQETLAQENQLSEMFTGTAMYNHDDTFDLPQMTNNAQSGQLYNRLHDTQGFHHQGDLPGDHTSIDNFLQTIIDQPFNAGLYDCATTGAQAVHDRTPTGFAPLDAPSSQFQAQYGFGNHGGPYSGPQAYGNDWTQQPPALSYDFGAPAPAPVPAPAQAQPGFDYNPMGGGYYNAYGSQDLGLAPQPGYPLGGGQAFAQAAGTGLVSSSGHAATATTGGAPTTSIGAASAYASASGSASGSASVSASATASEPKRFMCTECKALPKGYSSKHCLESHMCKQHNKNSQYQKNKRARAQRRMESGGGKQGVAKPASGGKKQQQP